jgi:predicted outer membrane repeat protein
LNEADQNGGGYYFYGGNVNKFENYLDFREYAGSITDGIAGDNGGAICVTQTTNLDLFNIDISNNAATNGGGIYNDCNWSTSTNSGNNGEHHFEQLLITKNSAYLDGGGIFTKQTFSCINSTLAENIAWNGNGGALAVVSFSGPSGNVNVTPVLMNSLLYDNVPEEVLIDDDYCIPQFFYCDIKGYITATNTNFTFTNLPSTWTDYGWTDLFNNPIPNYITQNLPYLTPNYQLSPNSLCIDVGYNYMCQSNLYPGFSYGYIPFPWGTDFDGQNRFVNTIDIGAKEYQTKSAWIDHDNLTNPIESSVVSVKPNPWDKQGELKVLLSNPDFYLTNIKLFNAYGQQLIDRNTKQLNSIELDMQDLGFQLIPGIYVIKIEYKYPSGFKNYCNKKIIIL